MHVLDMLALTELVAVDTLLGVAASQCREIQDPRYRTTRHRTGIMARLS